MAERKVHPNCIYRSNPYHECMEACYIKMEEVGRIQESKKTRGSLILIVPRKFSLRKKKGLTPSSSFDSQPDLKKALAVSDSPPSPTRFSFKKVESWNCELPFKGPQAGKADDPSFLKFLPKSKPSPEESPVEDDHQQDDDEKMSPIDSSDYTDSNESNKKVIGAADASFEPISEQESPEHPIICDSRVYVGDHYYVKRSVASILKSILNKYGDIAKDCKLTSVVMRSYYLECLCFVIRELQSTSMEKMMSRSKLKEMSAIAKDVEAVGIEVGWLQKVLDGIGEAVELTKKSRSAEAEKRKFDSDVKSVRKDLEARTQDLAQKEEEVAVARAQVEEVRRRLDELEQESSQLNEAISSIRSKVGSIDCKAKVDQIL